jgi:hypothetical protein
VSERAGDDPIDRRAEAEADAAAAEAGAVGGRRDEDEDPAEQPVREAGGGEAEGFEHAEHGDPAPDPTTEEFTPEFESDRETGGARGEADDFRSSERTGDV